MSGYTQQITFRYQQGNFLVSLNQTDHDYCRIPALQSWGEDTLPVQKCDDKVRMETFTGNVSENHKNIRPSQSKLVCIK